MSRAFTKRLRIPLKCNYKFPLFSNKGTLLTNGYTRVVIGKRGPYVEFEDAQIFKENFEIPKEEEYRLTNKVVFYVEYRSKDGSYVKLYFQKRKVAYADYKIGMYYISPFDLYNDYGLPIII